MSSRVEKVTPRCHLPLRTPTISVPKDSHGRPNPFWDASGEVFLSARAGVSSYSRNPSEGTRVRPVSNPSAHTSEQSCHTCRKPRYGNDKECVTERHSFFFRQGLIHFIWQLSSKGATVNVLSLERRGDPIECFPLPDGGLVTPPLSQPSLGEVDLIQPHTQTHISFWMSVTPCLIPLFPHASECCQAQRGSREL